MIATPPVRHGYVHNDGLRLHYLDHGGVGEPILLLHGVTGHAGVWHEVAPKLTSIGRVLALDLRGFGDSQWSPAHAYRTVDHAGDVVALLDAIGAARAALVGSSWGAIVALAVAHQHPSRVSRLALVDVEPSFTQSETELMPRPTSFESHAEIVAHERTANPHAPEALLEMMAAVGYRPGRDGSLVPKHDPFFFERWPFRSDDWWHALPTLRAPTLVVHAGASFVRVHVCERMAAVIPSATHAEIPHSTHVVPVDAPDALTDALLEFLG